MNQAEPVSPIVNLFNRLRQRRTNQPGAHGKAKNRPTEHDFPYTHPRYGTKTATEPAVEAETP